jgi:hypothetical protein
MPLSALPTELRPRRRISDSKFQIAHCNRRENLRHGVTLMGSVRRAASEKIICSFAEQVEVRSSQSLQLRGIYDV